MRPGSRSPASGASTLAAAAATPAASGRRRTSAPPSSAAARAAVSTSPAPIGLRTRPRAAPSTHGRLAADGHRRARRRRGHDRRAGAARPRARAPRPRARARASGDASTDSSARPCSTPSASREVRRHDVGPRRERRARGPAPLASTTAGRPARVRAAHQPPVAVLRARPAAGCRSRRARRGRAARRRPPPRARPSRSSASGGPGSLRTVARPLGSRITAVERISPPTGTPAARRPPRRSARPPRGRCARAGTRRAPPARRAPARRGRRSAPCRRA